MKKNISFIISIIIIILLSMQMSNVSAFDISESTDNNIKTLKTVYGDINNDGDIDSLDYATLKMYLLEADNEYNECYDLNKDNSVDAIDFALLKKYLLIYEQIEKTVDTDGDGLPDYYEKMIGTDLNKVDTDGDGINDYNEVILLHSDPLSSDSDKNGISDGDEIYMIKKSLEDTGNLEIKPTVTLELKGNDIDTLQINKISDYHDQIFKTFDGYTGLGFDFSVNTVFSEAIISYTFKDGLNKNSNKIYEICEFNEEENTLIPVENQEIDWESGTITAVVKHFSPWPIVERAWDKYNDSLADSISTSSLNSEKIGAIVFGIDISTEMEQNELGLESQRKRKSIASQLLDFISNDYFVTYNYIGGVVSTSSKGNESCNLIDSRPYIVSDFYKGENFYNQVFNSNYNVKANLDSGIKSSIKRVNQIQQEYAPNNDKFKKTVVILTDGNGSWNSSNFIENTNDIQLIIIGVGKSINETKLEAIAKANKQVYYSANTHLESLKKYFKENVSNRESKYSCIVNKISSTRIEKFNSIEPVAFSRGYSENSDIGGIKISDSSLCSIGEVEFTNSLNDEEDEGEKEISVTERTLFFGDGDAKLSLKDFTDIEIKVRAEKGNYLALAAYDNAQADTVTNFILIENQNGEAYYYIKAAALRKENIRELYIGFTENYDYSQNSIEEINLYNIPEGELIIGSNLHTTVVPYSLSSVCYNAYNKNNSSTYNISYEIDYSNASEYVNPVFKAKEDSQEMDVETMLFYTNKNTGERTYLYSYIYRGSNVAENNNGVEIKKENGKCFINTSNIQLDEEELYEWILFFTVHLKAPINKYYEEVTENKDLKCEMTVIFDDINSNINDKQVFTECTYSQLPIIL
ncbi:VWA domain-containing protein [Ruminiclostridium herbifermentans]|uniref:cellulase n=1 Tax=Ruminiclostridium herbifermentans TaxID=2488810 RepID=A0A4U7JIU6_9FIRM|nr:dockerin type I domain-containing protein [Ruminiclostridium herbifermentans]QNU68622.1 VWA domain-containing protein [Ruminiclostridium herbifermentans]